MKRTALYRHYDASGALLYVGISLDTIRRTQQHKLGAHWFERIARIEIEWLASRADAEHAERAAIKAERPAHNIVHNGGTKPAIDFAWSLSAYANEAWSKNEVLCTGEELGRTLWRGVQWAVTDHGVECRDGSYFICRSRLYEGMRGDEEEGWERHMEGKSWVNARDFFQAMRIARKLFPKGVPPADTSRRHPDLEAHPLVGRFFHTFKRGNLEWQGQVLAVDGDQVRAQLFDWFLGEPSNQTTLRLKFFDSVDCRVYSTRDAWLAAAEVAA